LALRSKPHPRGIKSASLAVVPQIYFADGGCLDATEMIVPISVNSDYQQRGYQQDLEGVPLKNYLATQQSSSKKSLTTCFQLSVPFSHNSSHMSPKSFVS
jgi:hypothetical protein